MSNLEKAIAIAAQAHQGQIDKAGSPYIFHPLRVMLRLKTAPECIVGVLHDVVEDTATTVDDLRAAGFSDEILRSLEAVTKRNGEDYEAFVLRAAADPIGRQVKLADLADNMDLSRIAEPTERDFARIEKYRRAVALIEFGASGVSS